jgi:hypothetical protein
LARLVYVNLDSSEVRKLLKSPEVASHLLSLGEGVASKAGPEYRAEVDNESRKSRVVVNVVDDRKEARFIEMSTGKLARALGESKK